VSHSSPHDVLFLCSSIVQRHINRQTTTPKGIANIQDLAHLAPKGNFASLKIHFASGWHLDEAWVFLGKDGTDQLHGGRSKVFACGRRIPKIDQLETQNVGKVNWKSNSTLLEFIA
jgi:hypothetical protein